MEVDNNNNEQVETVSNELKPIVVDNDIEYKPSSIDELYELAKKGLTVNDTPTNKLRVDDKDLIYTAMVDNNINQDDINALIDIKSGNKTALLKYIDDNDLQNIVEVTEDENGGYKLQKKNADYRGNNYIPSKEQVMIRKLYNELGDTVFDKLDNDFDEPSKSKLLLEDPNALYALNDDIKNGTYDKIVKTVRLWKNIGKISKHAPMLDSYIYVAQEINKKQNDIKASVSKTEDKKTQSNKTSLKKVAKMSDDEFREFWKQKYGDISR